MATISQKKEDIKLISESAKSELHRMMAEFFEARWLEASDAVEEIGQLLESLKRDELEDDGVLSHDSLLLAARVTGMHIPDYGLDFWMSLAEDLTFRLSE
jgi:hypothetical protein